MFQKSNRNISYKIEVLKNVTLTFFTKRSMLVSLKKNINKN